MTLMSVKKGPKRRSYANHLHISILATRIWKSVARINPSLSYLTYRETVHIIQPLVIQKNVFISLSYCLDLFLIHEKCDSRNPVSWLLYGAVRKKAFDIPRWTSELPSKWHTQFGPGGLFCYSIRSCIFSNNSVESMQDHFDEFQWLKSNVYHGTPCMRYQKITQKVILIRDLAL